MIARTGESTEKQPFTAHAQGMSRGTVEPRTDMPSGKGMPIKIPAGMRMIKARMLFTSRG